MMYEKYREDRNNFVIITLLILLFLIITICGLEISYNLGANSVLCDERLILDDGILYGKR